jgi:hypothetical protein
VSFSLVSAISRTCLRDLPTFSPRELDSLFRASRHDQRVSAGEFEPEGAVTENRTSAGMISPMRFEVRHCLLFERHQVDAMRQRRTISGAGLKRT